MAPPPVSDAQASRIALQAQFVDEAMGVAILPLPGFTLRRDFRRDYLATDDWKAFARPDSRGKALAALVLEGSNDVTAAELRLGISDDPDAVANCLEVSDSALPSPRDEIRIDGQPVGVVANNSAVRGGVLFVDSADKAARFIWLCDAFNVPLLYLADVPGFMIGSEVERQGIIRHGAKMITAVSEATVPQLSVVVRKAYGAGLYAMCGPGFMPDACIALTTAKIAVMGPEAAVNAVYANKIAELDDDTERAAFVAERRAEYEQDVDILRLAADLVLDAVVEPSELRAELVVFLAVAQDPRVGARGMAAAFLEVAAAARLF